MQEQLVEEVEYGVGRETDQRLSISIATVASCAEPREGFVLPIIDLVAARRPIAAAMPSPASLRLDLPSGDHQPLVEAPVVAIDTSDSVDVGLPGLRDPGAFDLDLDAAQLVCV